MSSRKFTPAEFEQIEENADPDALVNEISFQKIKRKPDAPHHFMSLSPFSDEKTPSFHMNWPQWYCFSTNEGGTGCVKFVMTLMRYRVNQIIDGHEAVSWLIDKRISHLSDQLPKAEKSNLALPLSSQTPSEPNSPLKKSLQEWVIKKADMAHPYLSETRKISRDTCQYLGFGYMEAPKSKFKNRIVFPIRSIIEGEAKVVGHIGRAINDRAKLKYLISAEFAKQLELYNQDKLLLDNNAMHQAQETGQVILVEGTFDVARLVDAGVLNVLALMGSSISHHQCNRLQGILEHTGAENCLVMLDRSVQGQIAQRKVISQLSEAGIQANGFNWDHEFRSKGEEFGFPDYIQDPGDFKNETVEWLRERELI